METEGYTKFECRWRKAELPAELDLGELMAFRDWLREVNLLGVLPDGVGFGNVSRRTSPIGQFAISGTQTGSIVSAERKHFALVERFDVAKNILECSGEVAASSESLSHGGLYSSSEEIGWVAHVHHAQFFAEKLGILPTTDKRYEYGTPGISEALRVLAGRPEVRSAGCIVMGGHETGLMFFARSMSELRRCIEEQGILAK